MMLSAYSRRRITQTLLQRYYFHSKVVVSAQEALAGVSLRNARVAVGGFGFAGVPETLIREVSKNENAKDLTVITLDGEPASELVESNKVSKLITSYIGKNKNCISEKFLGGQLEVDLMPQGTIAACLRAAGSGIKAIYSHTGTGTLYSDGGIPKKFAADGSGRVEAFSPPRIIQTFDGDNIEYILEPALKADISLVKAFKADTNGNLIFHGTARNSNPDVARAGKYVIAEVEHIVPAGQLNPDDVQVAGVFVDKVIYATKNEKRVNLRLADTTESSSSSSSNNNNKSVVLPHRERIIKRAAKELREGMTVNLGIGIPTGVTKYVPHGMHVDFHSENGLVGLGPHPKSMEMVDRDYINASKETVTPTLGSSIISSSVSFEIVRGGHLDISILGGLQVNPQGNLASWMVPGKFVPGMGGSMDLVGAPNSKIIITMEHVAKDGSPKIVQECTYPLTGKAVVDMIITDMAVFEVDKKGGTGLKLIEVAPGLTVADIRKVTAAPFKVAKPLGVMEDVESKLSKPKEEDDKDVERVEKEVEEHPYVVEEVAA